MAGDIIEYKGPMTGIFSALTMPDISQVFVTGCDMPFINAKLVKYIVDKWEESRDAVIPIFDKKPQPFSVSIQKELLILWSKV